MYLNELLCVFSCFYSLSRLCQPYFSLRPYQIHIKCTSISDLIYIHYIYCFTRMIYSVLFLFLLPFQSMSTVDFIDTLSKTDSYSLHKLLYQNKLFCVFLAFTPNLEWIIYLYHGYYIFW